MTNNEVNKIIAEFMEWETCNSGTPFIVHQQYGYESAPEFTQEPIYPCKSLDALIPVWEKANLNFQFISKKDEKLEDLDSYYKPIKSNYRAWVTEIGFFDIYWSDNETIQEASAHATAKAILELKK